MADGGKDNVLKVNKIKAKLSAEIQKIDENLIEIKKVKQHSIQKIELKKKELRELTAAEMYKEKDETEREMKIRAREIEARKLSVTLLDENLAKLDKQISKIQIEHDKATAELNLKKKKLNEQLVYYEALNRKLNDILDVLNKENKEHERKLNEMLKQKADLDKSNLSAEEKAKKKQELDAQITKLKKDHEMIVDGHHKKLSNIEVKEPKHGASGHETGSKLLTEKQIQELHDFEMSLANQTITAEERLKFLRAGHQITPSGRIITQNDRVMSVQEARMLGLVIESDLYDGEEERIKPDYSSRGSAITSSAKSSSVETQLDQRDNEYLKQVFGKSLRQALAELTAVQPVDPIHYLAHWFIKYRYNQEVDEVKRQEIQALMIERDKLEAARWHRELKEEAYLAVLEVLFRAEHIIMQQDYLKGIEMEGEYEHESFTPMRVF